MRDGVHFCCALNPLDKIVIKITRCPAGTISHADKMRHVRFEIANRLVEHLRRLGSFRRKELERKCGRILPHNVGNMHDSALPSFLARVSVKSHKEDLRPRVCHEPCEATSTRSSKPIGDAITLA